MVAGHSLLYLEFLGYALSHLIECEAYLESKVASTIDLSTALASISGKAAKDVAEASEASSATHASAEDVAEHREDVVHVHRREATVAESTGTSEGVVETKLVILLTALGVVQYVVSFCCFLELLLSFLVARVAIRVVFDGYLAVRLLDIVRRSVLANA